MPPHLRMNFRVVDKHGEILAEGRDFNALLAKFASPSPGARGHVPPVDNRWHKDNLTTWSCGTLPESVEVGDAGWTIRHYPALVDMGESVSLRLFPTAAEAAANHLRGTLRLLMLALGKPHWRSLCNAPKLSSSVEEFARGLEGKGSSLGEDIAWHALRRAAFEDDPPPRDAHSFEMCLAHAKARIGACQSETRQLVTAILYAAAERDAASFDETVPEASGRDMAEQIAWLCPPGFARTTPWKRLLEIPRYLDAIRVRQERIGWNAASDAKRLAAISPFWTRYKEFARAGKPAENPAALADYRWGIEEFRVQTFAQEIKTPIPISAKRLDALWAQAMGEDQQ